MRKIALLLSIAVLSVSCAKQPDPAVVEEPEENITVKTTGVTYIASSMAGEDPDNMFSLKPFKANITVTPKPSDDLDYSLVDIQIQYLYVFTSFTIEFEDILVTDTQSISDNKTTAVFRFDNDNNLDYSEVSLSGTVNPIRLHMDGQLKGHRLILDIDEVTDTYIEPEEYLVSVDLIQLCNLKFVNEMAESVNIRIDAKKEENGDDIFLAIPAGSEAVINETELFWLRHTGMNIVTESGKTHEIAVDIGMQPILPGITTGNELDYDIFFGSDLGFICPRLIYNYTYTISEELFKTD
jgi:hypothetical protein